MNRRTKQQATLQHLRSLANQPNEQARYALELLERERGEQVASVPMPLPVRVSVMQQA